MRLKFPTRNRLGPDQRILVRSIRSVRTTTSPPKPCVAMKRTYETFSHDHHTSRSPGKMSSSSIQLTETEANLRLLLLDVAQAAGSVERGKGDVKESTVLRWAGGWVRDKLLGLQSHDIDVAINNMTGKDFADRVRGFVDKQPGDEVHGISKQSVGYIHNVDANPEKSKHLATAMLRIAGLDIDFVNLRKEVYTDDSRAPEKLEFGTAEEDAERRDATINALFYNLNTEQVEDFTGGIADLQNKIVRTPLEPLQTFTDDPLRVLRLIRFASRLGFSIDPGTERYMADGKVLASLRVKISRERVGAELEKMLRGQDPRSALHLIDRLGLYSAIFSDPNREVPQLPVVPRWSVAYECLDELKRNKTPKSVFDLLVCSDEDAYVAWNLAALCPWMRIDRLPGPAPKGKYVPASALVAREAFKATNKVSNAVAASQSHLAEILDLKQEVIAGGPVAKQRDQLGMKIRYLNASGLWKLQILNALLVEATTEMPAWEIAGSRGEEASQRQAAFLLGWQKFLDHLLDMDVWDVCGMKGLINGQELATELGTKPGRWTGRALEICMEWQLRNPGVHSRDGAIHEVRLRADELAPLGLTLP